MVDGEGQGLRKRLKVWLRLLSLFLLIFLLTHTMSERGDLDPLDYVYSDLWYRLAGVRYQPEHVALVVIDDASLDAYREDPLVFWTPQIAEASRRLRSIGVQAIGLDFMFSLSPEQWLRQKGVVSNTDAEGYDLPIRQEIANGGLTLVASALRGRDGTDHYLLPASDFLLAVPDFDFTSHVGLVDLPSDKDGGVRHFVIAPELNLPDAAAGSEMPTLSLAILLALKAKGLSISNEGWTLSGNYYANNSEHLPIGYTGPPGTVPRISLHKLLEPGAMALPEIQALAGKVVIIGGEYAGMGDVHITPYTSSFFGGGGRYMTGPEIHANIVETLLSGRLARHLSRSETIVYQLLLMSCALWLFWRLRPLRASFAYLVLLVVPPVLAYRAFLNDLQLPVVELQVAVTLLFLAVMSVKYWTEERRRSQITDIFGRYVSAKVVEEIVAGEHVPELGGTSREVTVLFSDIRNFTTISERLSAQEVVEMLNNYFSRVCEVAQAEGGTIDKFIGDAVMVQFGAPLPLKDHADRALRSAIAIQRVAVEFRHWMSERFAGRDLPEFAVGVGLHTGEAVVGNIGSPSHLEYTVIGDTVNVASRIEGKTKELGCAILASEQTLAAATQRVHTGKVQSVTVKGRQQPLTLYQIVGMGAEDESDA